MTNADYTAFYFVVDTSGSTYTIAKDLEGGIATLLSEQASLPGKVTVDVALFASDYRKVFSLAAPQDVSVKIKSSGNTALYDAIGRSVVEFGETLSKMLESERPGKVIFAIATDGQENASQEYTSDAIKKLITTQSDEFNWDFIYLGANQDAVLVADNMGIRAGSAVTYSADGAGVKGSFSAVSGYVTRSRTQVGRTSFTDDERAKSTAV